MRDENINISDVIEVIETELGQQSTMFNGGGEILQPVMVQQPPQLPRQQQQQPYVKIIEQPASKALRFRYECEGRSAGSIPGASSTSENKTYPAIQVCGCKGRAVVVVSCVTKDAPYRPHPHNLVGREGCKKGVCTLEVSRETMTVTFSNLGIQCVKKKDIEAALKLREDIRVDPFKTGFSHRNQPTSIDLNAVRLCFQVFLEGDRPGKFTVPLTPVVSETIFDKKAMSDLVIVKLSDCVSYVDGGRKDIILLCEKVTKEDIQIRFYEEKDGQVVWEGYGDFQPSQVHKQTAIWFRTPRYRTLEVTEPVKVFIQLKRPSDGQISEALPFELLPLDSGRPAYWSFRRNAAKKANYDLFSTLLASDSRLLAKRQFNTVLNKETNGLKPVPEDAAAAPAKSPDDGDDDVIIVEKNNNVEPTKQYWCDYSTVDKLNKDNKVKNVSEERSFNELINQVAELDQIYSETQARLLNIDSSELSNTAAAIATKPQVQSSESFDDTKTYTSLQLAFKNPIEIDVAAGKYEDVVIIPESPVINVVKRESEAEKLPPLPPKRAKKIETAITGSTTSIQLSGKQADALLRGSSGQLSRSVSVSRSHSFNLQRPKSQGELNAPAKRLPPTPSSTLPNPKKRGFFSKLFGRNKQKAASASPSKRSSFSSSKSLQVVGNTSVGHSISNLSTRSYGDAVSIHIPLKDPEDRDDDHRVESNGFCNVKTSGDKDAEDAGADVVMRNVGESKDESEAKTPNVDDFNLDLTEAENYALYMSIAPHATQSEFDESSCYYAPVEGGRIYNDGNVIAESTTEET